MYKKPHTVCLTGGIGSGKSVVARICRLSGYDVMVYDCDREAKILMETDAELRKQLSETFGESVILPQGGIDRVSLAEIIFTSESMRKCINTLVHSAVRQDVSTKLSNAVCRVFIVETAVPSTSGIDSLTDEIWLVEAPEEVRLERAVRRDSSDCARIKARIKAQEGEFSNMRCPNIRTIINDGSAELIPQVLDLLSDIEKNSLYK